MMEAPRRRFAVCQLGSRMQYAVPRMLHDVGALDRLYTDVYMRDGWARALGLLPDALTPSFVRRLLSRGTPIPAGLVQSFPSLGLAYAVRNRLAADSEEAGAAFLWAGRHFGKRIVRSGFGTANAVYSFNTAALEVLSAARQAGLFTVVEQTIVPRAIERDVIAAEQVRHPGWETPPTHETAATALVEREAAEWALADVIVCGSDYVRDGVRRLGGPAERCVVVPYGVTLDTAGPAPRRSTSARLRVLTVGHVSLRKGAAYALAAAESLAGIADFRWVGPSLLTAAARANMARSIELTGALPRREVLKQYEWADVFLLPSVCEGSATVTYEALASGVPVITTPSAGSLVRHGIDGFIVATGDAAAMADRLRDLHGDRARLATLAENALLGAGRLTLASYRARLLPHLLASVPHQPAPQP